MGYFLPTLSIYSEKTIGLDLWQEILNVGSYDQRVVGWTEMNIAQELINTEIGANNNIQLLQANATLIPLATKSIDILYCLDMMEHITEHMDDLLSEFNRVLKDKGKLIVSLPIEHGGALIARQIFSKLVGISRDKYSVRELVKSFLARKAVVEQKKGHGSHKGYNYRDDIQSIRKYFNIEKIRYVPFNFLRSLNPTIIIKAVKK